MKKFFILTIVLLIICSSGTAQTIRVAAAANLRYVLDTIKTTYIQQHPGISLDITYGSSGTLVQQILNGAQFHIFMSADKIYPEKLKNEKMIIGDVKTYAYGRLVLWSNTIDLSKGITILSDNSVKKISIAKPETAPYGDRAFQVLKFYNLFDKIKNKIVYADNISQAAQYAASGNVEAGFIALSLTFAPEMSKGHYILIDTASYAPIEQACVLLKTKEENNAAQIFFSSILSKKYKSIFEAYGYRFNEQPESTLITIPEHKSK